MEEDNLNLISLYLSDIQKFHLLSREEEYELLKTVTNFIEFKTGYKYGKKVAWEWTPINRFNQ